MVSDFHVLIFFEAQAGKAEMLGRILVDLTAPSRAEPGCRYYEPFADSESPGKFTVIEAWDTGEHWQKHLQRPHVVKALTEIDTSSMLARPFTVQQLRSIG
jgi:quinol monooxygenase YgiN